MAYGHNRGDDEGVLEEMGARMGYEQGRSDANKGTYAKTGRE